MNIISNACTGGWYYRTLGLKFMNPFIWTRISQYDMSILVQNYDTMNFKNIVSSRLDFPLGTNTGWKIPFLNIDNKITLEMVHYRQDDKMQKGQQRTSGVDIFIPNAIEFSKETYFRRLERMTEKPIFLLYHQDCIPAPFETMSQFMAVDSPYERYIVMYDKNAYDWALKYGLDPNRVFLGNVKRNDQQPLVQQAEQKFNLKRFLSNPEYHHPIGNQTPQQP